MARSRLDFRKAFGSDASNDPLLTIKRGAFTPLLGSSFITYSSSGKPAWLDLIAVDDMTAAPGPGIGIRGSIKAQRLDTFALRFQGVGEQLTQRTYEFEHFSLGRISLFVVPTETSGYLAVINHLIDPLPAGFRIPAKVQRKPDAEAKVESRPALQPRNSAAEITSAKG